MIVAYLNMDIAAVQKIAIEMWRDIESYNWLRYATCAVVPMQHKGSFCIVEWNIVIKISLL